MPCTTYTLTHDEYISLKATTTCIATNSCYQDDGYVYYVSLSNDATLDTIEPWVVERQERITLHQVFSDAYISGKGGYHV